MGDRFRIDVVLDTNSIYVAGTDDVIRRPTAELIEKSSKLSDLELNWYLPETVVEERRYQLRNGAKELLGPAKRLRKLLGITFECSADVLDQAVDRLIKDQLGRLGLKTVQLNCTDVNWRQMANAAVRREAPFEHGNTEKGFKDALILETYFQLVASLPAGRSDCRAVLVSNDNRMKEAYDIRAKSNPNLRHVVDVDSLGSLINSIASHVSEADLKILSRRAQELFYEANNMGGLFFVADLTQLIFKKFDKVLAIHPEGYSAPAFKKYVIGTPKFISKERQRIRWSNKVRAVMEMHPIDSFAAAIAPAVPGDQPSLASVRQVQSEAQSDHADSLSQFLSLMATKLALASNLRTASHAFEVIWDCAHKADGSLADPKLIDCHYVDTTWQNR
jgi:hypothetical protein